MNRMKIYDCFTFYNEFELLDLRLKSLWDVVDCFVIVEANRRHTGESKNFNLVAHRDEFKQFASKIRYIAADLSGVPFNGIGDWAIENAQRDAIIHGLKDAEPDDLIMISDLDEIPAPDVFGRLHENKIALIDPAVIPFTLAHKRVTFPTQLLVPAITFLEVGALAMIQTLYYYYFDWASRTPWHGTVLTKLKNLTTPQDLRNQRNLLPRVAGGGIISATWAALTA